MVEDLDYKLKSLETEFSSSTIRTRAEDSSIFIKLCKDFDQVILLAREKFNSFRTRMATSLHSL